MLFVKWLNIFGLAAFAICGSVGNLITLVALVVDNQLNKTLGSLTRFLMSLLAVCDFIGCLVGMPLSAWNMYVGESPPFTAGSFFCNIAELSLWGPIKTSIWFLWILGFTRMVAVVFPMAYQRMNSSFAVKIVSGVVPLVLGLFLYVYYIGMGYMHFVPNDSKYNLPP